MRSPWQAGPAAGTEGPALVSVTEFTADRHSHTVPIALAGLRLRRSWPGTPGAVGMWLWTDPWHKRSGSVSLWTDERALYAFVGRPDHLRIVRAYKDRGAIRATAWTADRPDPAAAWTAAHALISGTTPWPIASVHTQEGPQST